MADATFFKKALADEVFYSTYAAEFLEKCVNFPENSWNFVKNRPKRVGIL